MNLISQLAGESTPEVKPQTDVTVVPYNAQLDVNADLMLPWLWNQLKADGLIDLYYPNRKAFGFARFVEMMSGGANVLLVATQKDGQIDRVMGFSTWTPMDFGGAKAATAGFIFLKEFWDGHITTNAAHLIMEHWFTVAELEVVIGNVAVDNRLANQFLSRLGWKKLAVVPRLQRYHDRACDANLWLMTKEDFDG